MMVCPECGAPTVAHCTAVCGWITCPIGHVTKIPATAGGESDSA